MAADEGVHRTHCCVVHGCKYGDKNCPVTNGKILQDYICEECSEVEGWTKLSEVKNRVTEKMAGTAPLVHADDYRRLYADSDSIETENDESALTVLKLLRSQENHISSQIVETLDVVDEFNQSLKDIKVRRNKVIELHIADVLAEQPWSIGVYFGGGATYCFDGGNIKDRPLLQELLEYVTDTAIWIRFEELGFTLECRENGDVDITIDNGITTPKEFIERTAIVVDQTQAKAQVELQKKAGQRMIDAASAFDDLVGAICHKE